MNRYLKFNINQKTKFKNKKYILLFLIIDYIKFLK